MIFGQQPPQPRIVLPVEGSAHDDGVNRRPGPHSARFLDQSLDEIERGGAAARHGAHRVQLIDHENAGLPRRFSSGGKHQHRRLLKIKMAAEIGSGVHGRGDAIEPERQQGLSSRT